jgi:hypothetical protein
MEHAGAPLQAVEQAVDDAIDLRFGRAVGDWVG